jgi:short-subunit dehydrogenase
LSKDKHWALVTGAASGIGRAVALDLAAQGYNLLLVDMNADGLSELKAELAESPVSVSLKTLDLTELSSLAGFCNEIECFDGTLDCAFLNAGVVTPGDVLSLDRALLTRDVDVNLKSAMWLNQACGRKMQAQGSGHIINTASMAALVSLKGAASYSASKFGLRGFLIALREELRPHGVFVSMMLPSAIDTPMLRYEANHGGSALNFLSNPSSVEDVVRVFNKAQRSKRLEYFIPYSDSLMGRLVCIFPGLLARFYPVLSYLGERGREKFLRSIDS